MKQLDDKTTYRLAIQHGLTSVHSFADAHVTDGTAHAPELRGLLSDADAIKPVWSYVTFTFEEFASYGGRAQVIRLLFFSGLWFVRYETQQNNGDWRLTAWHKWNTYNVLEYITYWRKSADNVLTMSRDTERSKFYPNGRPVYKTRSNARAKCALLIDSLIRQYGPDVVKTAVNTSDMLNIKHGIIDPDMSIEEFS